MLRVSTFAGRGSAAWAPVASAPAATLATIRQSAMALRRMRVVKGSFTDMGFIFQPPYLHGRGLQARVSTSANARGSRQREFDRPRTSWHRRGYQRHVDRNRFEKSRQEGKYPFTTRS